MAETKVAAELAFDAFIESYALKYEKAADCLSQDRDTLLAFYDFPAEHWKHLRTTNPIESTFATVRHRTIRSRPADGVDRSGMKRARAVRSRHRLLGRTKNPAR
jgi:transposase-like protein